MSGERREKIPTVETPEERGRRARETLITRLRQLEQMPEAKRILSVIEGKQTPDLTYLEQEVALFLDAIPRCLKETGEHEGLYSSNSRPYAEINFGQRFYHGSGKFFEEVAALKVLFEVLKGGETEPWRSSDAIYGKIDPDRTGMEFWHTGIEGAEFEYNIDPPKKFEQPVKDPREKDNFVLQIGCGVMGPKTWERIEENRRLGRPEYV